MVFFSYTMIEFVGVTVSETKNLVFDTTPSLPNTGEWDSSPIWNKWRPAE